MKIAIVGAGSEGSTIAARILAKENHSPEERINREEELKKDWKEKYKPLSLNILTIDLPSRRP